VQLDHGFIYDSPSDCDSLLFSSLLHVGGADVDYRQAEDVEIPGRWYRTPFKDCFANSGRDDFQGRKSGSTTSVDMLAGVLWAAHYTGDLALAEDLISYGKKNKWFMGDPKGDRTFMWPPQRQVLYAVAGKKYGAEQVDFVDPRKDHQRHQVALFIILGGEVTGNISDGDLALLKKFYELEPKNALFSYGVARFGSGDFSATAELLRDVAMFPKHRLPTNKDRCGNWLWVRSDNHEGRKPCAKKKRHSGGDYLLIAKLLEDALER
jgi:hypothetical protein